MKLELREVTKSYGKFEALSAFSAELTPGVYGLLGPNGAGKTTLIKAIVGVHKIDKGQILYNGCQVNDSFLAEVGFLPQAPLLYANYSAPQFLRYMCVIKGVSHGGINSTIDDLLKKVNLDKETKNIGEFSGGMRQRLGIAQALINDPTILILDEPTAGLDPQERLRFRNIISKLSIKKIVILATHIVSDIENIAKEIILLKDGRNIGVHTPQSLLEKTSPFVWYIENLTDWEYQELENRFLISNVKIMGEKVTVRLLSKVKPHPQALNVEANLEDVYLITFRDEDL